MGRTKTRFNPETGLFSLEFGFGRNVTENDYLVREVTYQRNGSSGEGFHVVRFVRWPYDGVELTAVVFEKTSHVAVVDMDDLGSHFRGDNFEDVMRQVVDAHDDRRDWAQPTWKVES